MSVRRVVHCLAIAAVPVLIAACGGSDSSGATTSQVNVTPGTAFATIPPPTTTSTLPGGTPGGPTTTAGATTYTVVANDYLLKIAKQYGVTVEALTAANSAVPGFPSLQPGMILTIPAGGTGASAPGTTIAGGSAPGTTTAGGGSATTTATTAGGATTAPGSTTAGGQCPGKYKITAEDNARTKVAAKFGITVEALDAANASTPGYSAFYPGLEIVIPC